MPYDARTRSWPSPSSGTPHDDHGRGHPRRQGDPAGAAQIYGNDVSAHLTRRNLTVDHGVVPREPGALFRIGPVLLQVVRVAAPCKLLDDTIGPGAHHAMRHRGGSVCRVLAGGDVVVGDVVDLAAAE